MELVLVQTAEEEEELNAMGTAQPQLRTTTPVAAGSAGLALATSRLVPVVELEVRDRSAAKAATAATAMMTATVALSWDWKATPAEWADLAIEGEFERAGVLGPARQIHRQRSTQCLDLSRSGGGRAAERSELELDLELCLVLSTAQPSGNPIALSKVRVCGARFDATRFDVRVRRIQLMELRISRGVADSAASSAPRSQKQQRRQRRRRLFNHHAYPFHLKRLFWRVVVAIVVLGVLARAFPGRISQGLVKLAVVWFGAQIVLLTSFYFVHSAKRHPNLTFFLNGWNAWSFAGAVRCGDRVPIFETPSFLNRAFHDGSSSLEVNLRANSRFLLKPDEEYISSDMFTAISDRDADSAVILGFLSQRQQFGTISATRDFSLVRVACDCDSIPLFPTTNDDSEAPLLESDWFYLEVQSAVPRNPFANYLALSQPVNGIEPGSFAFEAPSGWCSWYHFFKDISEKALRENVERMIEFRKKVVVSTSEASEASEADSNSTIKSLASEAFNLFQIDDGYQSFWGDWLQPDCAKFPSASEEKEGKKSNDSSDSTSFSMLAEFVRRQGLCPGIWMAPFAADFGSALVKDHPEWVLRRKSRRAGKLGKPIASGFCGKYFCPLDISRAEVCDFVLLCVRKAVEDWGFQYLKLDFLYAAVVREAVGVYASDRLTRAQLIFRIMAQIKKAAADKAFILGCGAPLGSAVGLVHGNRISADAGLSWYPEHSIFRDKWNLPSARNMVRNTLTRSFLSRFWWINDPDCLLLRDSTKFTEDELLAMATVKALSGGSLLVSDNLAAVSSRRFRILQQLLPPLNFTALPLDLLDREMPQTFVASLPSPSVHVLLGESESDDFEYEFVPAVPVTPAAAVPRDHKHRSHTDMSSSFYSRSGSGSTQTVNHFPEYALVGLFNWEDGVRSSQSIRLEDVIPLEAFDFHDARAAQSFRFICHVYDFWSESYQAVFGRFDRASRFAALEGSEGTIAGLTILHEQGRCSLRVAAVPAHGCRLLALRVQPLEFHFPEAFVPSSAAAAPFWPRASLYLGSDLHFSCGGEVESLQHQSYSGPKIFHHFDPQTQAMEVFNLGARLELVLKPEFVRSQDAAACHALLFLPSLSDRPTEVLLLASSHDKDAVRILAASIAKVRDIHIDSRCWGSVWKIPFGNTSSSALEHRTLVVEW